jgi:hypothetical protein
MRDTEYKGVITKELFQLYVTRFFAGMPYGIKANLGGETQLTVTVYGISIKENLNKKECLKYEHDSHLTLCEAFALLYNDITDIRTFGKLICDKNDYVYSLIDYHRRSDTDEWVNDVVKPYLRPIASMTEAEKAEFDSLPKGYTADISGDRIMIPMYVDWLNARHFDYSGLIEKGLALEAPIDLYEL